MAAAAARRRRLETWAADNESGVRGARVALTTSTPGVHVDLGPHHSTFNHILQQIQGLPVTSATLPVELDVCFNTVCLSSHAAPFSTEADEVISRTLSRVLQVSCVRVEAATEVHLWSAALSWAVESEAARRGLGQLLTLQAFLWLLRGEVQRATALLSLTKEAVRTERLSDRSDVSMESPTVSACGPSGPLQDQPFTASHTILDPENITQALSTWDALMKGNALCLEGKWLDALHVLQEVSQRCTSRRFLALAQNLMSRCLHSLGKLHLAMVCYRRCTETYVRHLSALYGLSLVFRELGKASAELEALTLLSNATGLQDAEKEAEAMGGDSIYLLGQGPEALLCRSVVRIAEHLEPAGALYLLASRSRQWLRFEEAVERYQELLVLLSDSADVQAKGVGLNIPRIPALYLELAFTFLRVRKHDRVIAICDDVISKTSCMIPQKLMLEIRRDSADTELHVALLKPQYAEESILSSFSRDALEDEVSSYPQTLTSNIGKSSRCSFAGLKQDLGDQLSCGELARHWVEFGWLWRNVQSTLPRRGATFSSRGSQQVPEHLHAVLWTVSARVLRAAALLELGTADDALRELDRCTEELFKVNIVPSLNKKECSGQEEMAFEELAVNLLKSLVFESIARCLETMSRDTDALRYYLCSLQANSRMFSPCMQPSFTLMNPVCSITFLPCSPVGMGTPMTNGVHSMYGLVRLLSKRNRKREAVAHWLKFRGLVNGDMQINTKSQSLVTRPDLGPYNYIPEQVTMLNEGELLEMDQDFLQHWQSCSSEEQKILHKLATGLLPLPT